MRDWGWGQWVKTSIFCGKIDKTDKEIYSNLYMGDGGVQTEVPRAVEKPQVKESRHLYIEKYNMALRNIFDEAKSKGLTQKHLFGEKENGTASFYEAYTGSSGSAIFIIRKDSGKYSLTIKEAKGKDHESFDSFGPNVIDMPTPLYPKLFYHTHSERLPNGTQTDSTVTIVDWPFSAPRFLVKDAASIKQAKDVYDNLSSAINKVRAATPLGNN